MNKYRLLIILFFVNIFTANAQLCTGSLGDAIVNIDFGSGIGRGPALGSAITAYTYSASGQLGEGEYTISNTTSGLKGTAWVTSNDHTPNDVNGYMMVINCATLASEGVFYTKTVSNLCQNTTYEFSAWIMNVMNFTSPNPNVTFRISTVGGTILGTYNTGEIPVNSNPTWNQYGFYFTTGTATQVVLKILNSAPSAFPGNDLALDDITFRACGPLVSTTVENYSTTNLTACENQVPQYTFNGSITSGVYTTPAYQWQSSTDGGITWTDIAGATSINYTVQPEQTAGVYMYRLSTAESTNISSASCRVSGTMIKVTVYAAPITPTVTTTSADCSVSNGSITVTSTTGVTYSIDGTNYVSSNVFSGLPSGSYSVTVKNTTTGCVSNVTVAQVGLGGEQPTAPNVTALAPTDCATTNGTITVNDIASQFSYDNGVTWSTSNVAFLPPGDYLVVIENEDGCISVASAVTIPTATGFPETPTLVIVQPDCTTSTGSIIVTDIQSAYSFDNGITWVSSNSISNLSAGTYSVLTKNALGCSSEVVTVIITDYVNNVELPSVVSQIFCDYEFATLNDIVISGTLIQWYANSTGGTSLDSSTILQNATYYATQTLNGCESLRVPVTISIQNTTTPSGDSLQQFCTTQHPTVALLNANGTNIQWYATSTNGFALSSSLPLVNGNTYYATQTINGCESQVRFSVTVTIVSPTTPVNNVSHTICDELNDGTESINLADYNLEITTETGCVFSYYTSQLGAENAGSQDLITNSSTYNIISGSNTIFVRVDSTDKCYQVVTLNLTLIQKPVISLSDIIVLCENQSILLSAGVGFNSYTWSTGETTSTITITTPGNYWVTVTQITGDVTCSTTKNFTVTISNAATITNIEVKDWTDNENSITIYVSDTSVGNYEYSIDGILYQDSSSFFGLLPGEYTVYVKDKNGCGISYQIVYLLNYPKFFTPNGDGYNDTWQVFFSSVEPNLITKIFDRYGKLITVLSYQKSWDGTYNGVLLPSTDYWFVVIRENGKIYKGHFSMKR